MAGVGSMLGFLPSGLASGQTAASAPALAEKKRPNLLYIFPDQFRIQSLGIWKEEGYTSALRGASDPVVTPNLDALARDSILFSQATSTYPVCSPYRGMFMSGMYPANNGVGNNCREGRLDSLRHDVDCLTDVLNDSGFETAYVGKTHWEENQNLFDENGNYVGLKKHPGGHLMNNYDTYIPEGRGRHGNKFWFQCVKDVHKDPRVYASDPRYAGGMRDGEQYRPGVYSPKLEADVIIDYLKNQDEQRDPDRPFSLIWAPNPPHNPYSSEKDCDEVAFRKYYRDKSPNDLLVRGNLKANSRSEASKSVGYYFANVTGIDTQIGRVLRALSEIGEADNTVIVFTSDHGEMMGSHGKMGKNVIYEESMLVPFMIRYPKKIRHRLEDLMLTPVDIMPTLLGLLGLESDIPESVEGTNYADATVSGNFDRQRKPETVPYIGPRGRGIRSNRYTLYIDRDRKNVGHLLFDNLRDPYQVNSLPLDGVDRRVVSDLFASLGSWLKEMNDPWYQQRKHSDLIPY